MYIQALFAGKPAPFGPNGTQSSIVKQRVSKLTVHLTHTDEDEQGNKKLHGGREKVLHQYSLQAYQQLAHHFKHPAFLPGTMGENISVEGMHDHNVLIGDCYQFGEVIAQVGSPRTPCVKISQRYKISHLDQFVAMNGLSGWYFRILQGGIIQEGDDVTLLQRSEASMSVSELMKGVTQCNHAIVQRALLLPSLDPHWHKKCRSILSKAQKKPQLRLF